jgi:ArsR family transcriptional regulator, arsenate/arsenite/antimonite-responsive transcriptional repressor
VSELAAIECCAPLAGPVLSDEEAEATAAIFRALGDPARVRIVNLLAHSGAAVCSCELQPTLELSQPTVSHHLKKLAEAGLVDREQRGKWAYFTINPDAARRLSAVADLKGACC